MTPLGRAPCDTGINAAVLARREQLTIPLRCCLWADLPGTIAERFDVVLCVGNSLVHAASSPG